MDGQGENDELYPIAVLIDELKVGHNTCFTVGYAADLIHSTTMFSCA